MNSPVPRHYSVQQVGLASVPFVQPAVPGHGHRRQQQPGDADQPRCCQTGNWVCWVDWSSSGMNSKKYFGKTMPLIFVLGRFSQQIRRNRWTHLYKRTPYTCNQTHLCQVRSCEYTPTPRYTSCYNSGMTSCLVLQIFNRLPTYY